MIGVGLVAAALALALALQIRMFLVAGTERFWRALAFYVVAVILAFGTIVAVSLIPDSASS